MPDTHHKRPSFILADRFERFAEIHGHFYRPWITAALPSRGGRAVDLGCGSGRFAPLLAERYEQVLAVDIAERELEIARAKRDRPNVTYARRSLLDVTPATDGRFDLVFSVNTFHLRDHDRVLPHVKDLVAPDGHAILVDIVTADPTRYASGGTAKRRSPTPGGCCGGTGRPPGRSTCSGCAPTRAGSTT